MQKQLLEAACLGQDLEEFLTSRTGEYFTLQIDIEEKELTEALVKCSPWRKNKIAKIQAEISAVRKLKSWIAEAITTGRQSEQLLEGSD